MLNANLQVMKEQAANTMSMFTPIQYSSIEEKGVACQVIPGDQPPVDTDCKAEVILEEPMKAYLAELEARLAKRRAQLRSSEKFTFFTFHVDVNNDMFVSWPVSGYHAIPSRIIHRDQRTLAAVSRLSRRSHIQAIKVVGPIRTYDQYFPWIKEQYEV